MAFSDLSGYACSAEYGGLRPDMALCKAILPYQSWRTSKALETQAVGYGRDLKKLLDMMRDTNDFLGLNLKAGRDLTLHGAEAHVVPELTTLSQPQVGIWFRTPSAAWDELSYLNIFEDPPALGHCWRFPGSRGHVAIQLEKPSNISAITVGYPLRENLSPGMVLQAPKLFRVWGVPAQEVGSHCVFPDNRQQLLSRFAGSRSVKKPLSGRSIAYQLIEFQYDIHRPRLRQKFPIREGACSTFPIVVIVVEVMENWGGETTCVYRVGVHGSS